MTNKANGVYYTPRPVVDYIVHGTLAPLLAGKSPMQLAGRTERGERVEHLQPLTILDPACGSGYFLLGAYDLLLEWCLRWYREHDPERWRQGRSATLRREGNLLRLTLAERNRILDDHLFGVDIDKQAIYATQHALLTKAYDGQQEHDAGRLLSFASPLDAIGGNIRCGNSLIGTSFHEHHTQADHVRVAPSVAAFDWQDAFPAVMAAGGFDAIVGNPPYVNARLVTQEQGEAVKQYFREQYRCAHRAFDLYVLFIERSHQLLRQGGRGGMIVPNKIATLDYARPCRELLLSETTLDTITDVSAQQLFPGASVYPYIITWTKRLPGPEHRVRIVCADGALDHTRVDFSRFVRQAAWSAAGGMTIHQSIDVEHRVPTHPLGQRGSLHSGTTGFRAERMANALREHDAEEDGESFAFIVSGNIDRYSISPSNVRFMNRVFEKPVLSSDSSVLTTGKRELFSNPKIVLAGMSRRLEAAYDPGGLALGVQVYAVTELQDDSRFLLAVLNSKLMTYLWRTRFQAKRLAGGYLTVNKSQLAKLPIRLVDEQDRRAVSIRDKIIELVDGLPRGNLESDHEIDRLVYQLYALTDDEIETVQATLTK